jgi:HD-GYP domain-containing protein (c-di-GMP phosphodiesterase class II)
MSKSTYVPLPIDEITLGEPLPVDVWDGHEQLLLRKGQPVRDERHREWLRLHHAQVRADEFRHWTYRYNAAIERALRQGQALEEIAAVTRPMGLQEDPEPADGARPIEESWADLHQQLTLLLHQGAAVEDFADRFLRIEYRARALTRSRIDDSLFVLVQMLMDRRQGYSASHALLCGLVVRLVGETLGWSATRLQALQRAAMTMNVGMARLHDDLARQSAPLTREQRRAVFEHPLRGESILRAVGVRDDAWLSLVRDHHEQMGGGGYPQGHVVVSDDVQLLRMADVYVARISPRLTRPGLPAPRAARDVYVDASGMPTALGSAFVRTLGLYVPGSYVELASHEIAVVARRGSRANVPLVFALTTREGLARGEPPLRDTAEPAYAVKRAVDADKVKIRLMPSRLLSRI